MELERDGVFELERGRKHARVDWKGRYARFRTEVPAFRPPFGTAIGTVMNPDEVAYSRCRLRTDLLTESMEHGVYIEVEVLTNPDNLSLAVVDFEAAGGRSSVTFSPDTGAVIRERKVREAPRKVEGAYIQPLSTTPAGSRFEGSIALYLHRGHLAFFRRCARESELGPWESTGFISDLTWAEGKRITPCLAFRDEGDYQVRVARVGSEPPLSPERTSVAYDESWSGLDWEAGQTPDA
jgi:hypothetical protein